LQQQQQQVPEQQGKGGEEGGSQAGDETAQQQQQQQREEEQQQQQQQQQEALVQQGKAGEGIASLAGNETGQQQQQQREEGQQQRKEQDERQAQLLQQVRALAGTHYSSWGAEAWAAVLAYEDVLRLSPETQAAYEAAEQHSSSNDWLDVTEGLQRRVLAEAGLSSNQMAAGLATMRGAPYRWVLVFLQQCVSWQWRVTTARSWRSQG
jgi:hypothetical protein